jgi:hypothetical protein
MKGLESVTSDDIRRDFGIEGKLVDYFGDTLLGAILESAPTAGSEAGSSIREPAQLQPQPRSAVAPGGSDQ